MQVHPLPSLPTAAQILTLGSLRTQNVPAADWGIRRRTGCDPDSAPRLCVDETSGLAQSRTSPVALWPRLSRKPLNAMPGLMAGGHRCKGIK